ncbi:MAG: folylpolyglutamate synthase/dihydrofolate synthase family protein [Candidatus Omnitrophota bacterium]
MTYPETIKYLESFINYEKIPTWSYKESLKLERIKDFLSGINNPQKYLRCIHVAGSKGKGSTCAFIAYILKEHGFRVGLYTSPHLSDFRERIRILNSQLKTPDSKLEFEGMISKKELSNLVTKLKPIIEKYNKHSIYGPLSFFEVYTSLAFMYFKEKKVDFTVLETGLGGRLDATNVVNPLVCAITPLSYEHTQKLGKTLREIAIEKAGIIKAQNLKRKTQNLIVITAPQEKEAMQVIRNRCKEMDAELHEIKKYKNLSINLLGNHQIINASVAMLAVEALRKYGFKIKKEAIKNGLIKTIWPGRCEVISKKPWVILDGAQNVASARVLKKTIKDNFSYERLILIIGVSKDKDIKGICNELDDLADIIIITQANNPRATESKEIAKYFKNKPIFTTRNVREARTKMMSLVTKPDLVLVTGSLFVVGEFREIYTDEHRF